MPTSKNLQPEMALVRPYKSAFNSLTWGNPSHFSVSNPKCFTCKEWLIRTPQVGRHHLSSPPPLKTDHLYTVYSTTRANHLPPMRATRPPPKKKKLLEVGFGKAPASAHLQQASSRRENKPCWKPPPSYSLYLWPKKHGFNWTPSNPPSSCRLELRHCAKVLSLGEWHHHHPWNPTWLPKEKYLEPNWGPLVFDWKLSSALLLGSLDLAKN